MEHALIGFFHSNNFFVESGKFGNPYFHEFAIDFHGTLQITNFREYIRVHKATRWTIRHGLMLLWFKDLMNVTKKLQFIGPMF